MGKQFLEKNTNFIDMAAILSMREANDAEFRAYAALPEIGGEELGRWFCAGQAIEIAFPLNLDVLMIER